MGWRDTLLRYLADSALGGTAARLDLQRMGQVLDRIDADDELDRRLDELDADAFVREFMRLYEEVVPPDDPS